MLDAYPSDGSYSTLNIDVPAVKERGQAKTYGRSYYKNLI